ncbi:hypothetical protein Patl1_12412 [Pistacia atlantica]|uniref:Uncharacterized protein n=1 Tax=Pistacia atlantica TaxID=434234 RepID=A0ACC1A4X9_9ROSI|nr:hypothetical protein Patl1_12412 [Pistacia atlantica]
MMSVSLEALAMAGTDYAEWGMDFEEWEHREDLEPPPPHLLADEEDDVRRESLAMESCLRLSTCHSQFLKFLFSFCLSFVYTEDFSILL